MYFEEDKSIPYDRIVCTMIFLYFYTLNIEKVKLRKYWWLRIYIYVLDPSHLYSDWFHIISSNGCITNIICLPSKFEKQFNKFAKKDLFNMYKLIKRKVACMDLICVC